MKKGWTSKLWKRAVGCYLRTRKGWRDWRSKQRESEQGEEFALEEIGVSIANGPTPAQEVQRVTGRPPIIECPPFTYRYVVQEVMQVHDLPEGLAMIHIDDYIANGQDWREACVRHTRNIWV